MGVNGQALQLHLVIKKPYFFTPSHALPLPSAIKNDFIMYLSLHVWYSKCTGCHPTMILYVLPYMASLLWMCRCVYLLNTKHDIHVCLNVNGTYEITPAAEMLQLSSYFTVPPNTTGSGGGYMIIHHPDFVLDRAVISCRVNISTFTGISYHSLRLRGTRIVCMYVCMYVCIYVFVAHNPLTSSNHYK